MSLPAGALSGEVKTPPQSISPAPAGLGAAGAGQSQQGGGASSREAGPQVPEVCIKVDRAVVPMSVARALELPPPPPDLGALRPEISTSSFYQNHRYSFLFSSSCV